MIRLEGIEKTYGGGAAATPVLRGIDLAIERGEYLAIMGRSGTGKSTLMNILGALDRPTRGGYRLAGDDVFALDDDALSALRNRKIGFVFQQFHLMDRASALENVLLPFVYRDEEIADAERLAARALEAVGLADRMKHRPGELSGGQQQRVAIARALVTDPALLLADEPTGNLDAASGAEVLELFDRLNAEGRTIVLVTHDRAVAERARRIVVLEDGRVAEDRTLRGGPGGGSEAKPAAPAGAPARS